MLNLSRFQWSVRAGRHLGDHLPKFNVLTLQMKKPKLVRVKCLPSHSASYRQGSTHGPQPRLFPTLFSWKQCFVKCLIMCETGVCEVQQL